MRVTANEQRKLIESAAVILIRPSVESDKFRIRRKEDSALRPRPRAFVVFKTLDVCHVALQL